jgi:pyocin large subunit-like protein
MITRFERNLAVLGAAAIFTLAGCSREADRAARPEAQAQAADPAGRLTDANYSQRRAPVQDTAPAFDDGKPAWASSRRYSVQESEQRQFERNGAAFQARSEQDYVAKVHAFVDSPPHGVLTVSRSNGDTLYYDPKANTFAVVDKEGAPRTMFKPREGMAYWTQQKQNLADNGARRRRNRDQQGAGDDSNG